MAVFPDSPRSGGWGDRPYSIADITGPASYTQITPGANPSGGQLITPSTFGLVAGMEGIVCVSGSTTGLYHVIAIQDNKYYPGAGNPNWILRWVVSATGAEVAGGTNLSAQTVRCLAFGPY